MRKRLSKRIAREQPNFNLGGEMIHTYLECKYRIDVYDWYLNIKLVTNCAHPSTIGVICCKRLCRTKKCPKGFVI